MISVIKDTPLNVAAFVASGHITTEDFEQVVIPKVKNVIEEYGELNYLLKIDTDLGDFTAGAWLQDALLGIKNLTKWHRAAIVTDEKGIQRFTNIFSIIMPGEFKGFDKADLQGALLWASGK